MSASSTLPTSTAKLLSSQNTGMPSHMASTAAMLQLVTKHHASLRSSDRGTLASLGPDVPLPLGLCRSLIGLSVYLLICSIVSLVQFGLSRYPCIPVELGQTKTCLPAKFGAFILRPNFSKRSDLQSLIKDAWMEFLHI